MENNNEAKMYSSYGYQIKCDQNEFQYGYSLLKIYFGKKFYIVRAKSVKSFIDNLGKQIRTGLNKKGLSEDALLVHVVKHIIRARPLSGIVERVDSFDTALQLIKAEQTMLDQYQQDPLCLNNNSQAYVPIGNDFLNEQDKQRFLKWFEKR